VRGGSVEKKAIDESGKREECVDSDLRLCGESFVDGDDVPPHSGNAINAEGVDGSAEGADTASGAESAASCGCEG
jgi:hypothetical protein